MTRSWPTDQVERWPLTRIKPYPKNPRQHPETQIRLLANIFEKYGPDQPIVVDEKGVILKGHGRLLAAQQANMLEFPVIRRKGLSAAQKIAIRLHDNQIQLLSEWDNELLGIEISELQAVDFDLAELGFSDNELFRLLNHTTGLTDPEEAPEPVPDPYVKVGEFWQLGHHRLICGDCTQADAVDRLLGGTKPHLMVTDPPYGVDYDPDWRNRAHRPDGKPYSASAIGRPVNDDHADWRKAWALCPSDVIYEWHPVGADQMQHFESLCAVGFDIRMQIIWAKQQFPIGRGHYHVQHEACWYAVRKGKNAHWQGSRTQSTLWHIDKPVKSETGHSTQKPIECMKRPIENNSKAGETVYDPFVGSGTTLIAAEMTARKCYAIEIDPAYCQVVIERWQNFTGKKAKRLTA
jgi:DNA modification methylase